MKYPKVPKDVKIGVTAPSSGVTPELHHLIHQSTDKLKSEGYEVVVGETVWTQDKAKSAKASVRAKELQSMMENPDIHLVFPPWGGELLIEILDKLDFEKFLTKWVLGYSDTSVLLLAITLKTGIATAHGPALVDVRGEYSDPTTVMWSKVITETHSIEQISSEKYQLAWDHANPTPEIFHLTESTYWKTVSNEKVQIKGRLLGGCIDVIRHLVGTSYGDVSQFMSLHTRGEPLIWYLENCELSAADLRRSLVQLNYAGWFKNCVGILFGRNGVDLPTINYTYEDVYHDLAEDLGIPIVYDADFGHKPPQMTFINGAVAEVIVEDGKGKVIQWFK